MGTAKKVNLAEVFKQNEQPQKPELSAARHHDDRDRVTAKAVVESAPTAPKKVAPSREKKKHIGGYFDEAVYRQMKHIGVEKGMTTQDILKEALNGFFQLHDKPPIA